MAIVYDGYTFMPIERMGDVPFEEEPPCFKIQKGTFIFLCYFTNSENLTERLSKEKIMPMLQNRSKQVNILVLAQN